jgi:hypothetical protein
MISKYFPHATRVQHEVEIFLKIVAPYFPCHITAVAATLIATPTAFKMVIICYANILA